VQEKIVSHSSDCESTGDQFRAGERRGNEASFRARQGSNEFGQMRKKRRRRTGGGGGTKKKLRRSRAHDRSHMNGPSRVEMIVRLGGVEDPHFLNR